MFDNPEGSKTFVVQLGRWPEGANIAIKEPHGIVNLEEMILTVFISIKFHTVLSMAEFVFQNGEKILKRFQDLGRRECSGWMRNSIPCGDENRDSRRREKLWWWMTLCYCKRIQHEVIVETNHLGKSWYNTEDTVQWTDLHVRFDRQFEDERR